MSSFNLVAALLLLAAILGVLNHRYFRLPRSIGVMAGALALSVVIVIADMNIDFVELRAWWTDMVTAMQLPDVFLNGVLAFMLFAGSLHVDMDSLTARKWTVISLATIGVLLATVVYALGIWVVFGFTVPLTWCFVLGALLAPTDPIAVGGLLREAGLPPSLLAVVNGESLLNDGVAVVLFAVALQWATGHTTTPGEFALDLAVEAGGGVLLGLITGRLAFYALRLVDEASLELTITLALVTATYSIAQAMHVSGPLAVVIAGLLTGHRSARFAMTDQSREQVMLFWELVDELLNAVLFLLMGFTLLSIHLDQAVLIAGAGGIVLSLVTRLISVVLGTAVIHFREGPRMDAVAVLTWGGLRGGISIALALTLDPSAYRGDLLAVCYAVVVWTILVQGLTVPVLVRRLFRTGTAHR